jgi:argininosuccinate lyase
MPRFSQPQDPDFQAINVSLDFDWRLWRHDIAQSRAHASMLATVGVISDGERDELLAGLDAVAAELADGTFVFGPDDEDIHMAIERRLTELVGRVGGKLHTARSRNDQVATDVVLFVREASAASAGRARCPDRGPAGGAPSSTSTGRCRGTPTSSAPSRSISGTTCSPTSGCSCVTAVALRR